ncbi:cyanophycinase-like exopeptidase [Chitinophaga skermanii]|uniref:Cyanophycinase-like exopeptidase n=2 Tax=Chitinophaga skermanii TaxID=331697 RepID=A0A327QRI1_9BACT|nr:cyanophycinase-like exopeptidase [Chitinophaga skermanii]
MMLGCAFALTLCATAAHAQERPGSLAIIGDTADVQTKTQGGIALVGGGGDVDEVYKWMIARSGGGDAVILRATNDDVYNAHIWALGKLNSIETLNINSRELANDDRVARVIRNAEFVFIAGGDQSNYMRYWRDTKVSEALQYLMHVKKVPIGGTSAGCASLSGYFYSGEKGSAVSTTALANPYNENVTIYNNFLQPPFLQNVLTDQHYLKRNREGRHVAFLARAYTDWGTPVFGIAPDERTGVCIDDKGMATVIGESKAYFIIPQSKPTQCKAGEPLEWNHHHKAMKVYEIQGSITGNGSFDVKNFAKGKGKGGAWYWWWVENGNWEKEKVN